MADATARHCIKRVKYIMNSLKNAFVWMIHMENIINKNTSVRQKSNEFSTDGHTIKKIGLFGHCIDLKEDYSEMSVKIFFLLLREVKNSIKTKSLQTFSYEV